LINRKLLILQTQKTHKTHPSIVSLRIYCEFDQPNNPEAGDIQLGKTDNELETKNIAFPGTSFWRLRIPSFHAVLSSTQTGAQTEHTNRSELIRHKSWSTAAFDLSPEASMRIGVEVSLMSLLGPV
jgi:hypothetical protein